MKCPKSIYLYKKFEAWGIPILRHFHKDIFHELLLHCLTTGALVILMNLFELRDFLKNPIWRMGILHAWKIAIAFWILSMAWFFSLNHSWVKYHARSSSSSVSSMGTVSWLSGFFWSAWIFHSLFRSTTVSYLNLPRLQVLTYSPPLW